MSNQTQRRPGQGWTFATGRGKVAFKAAIADEVMEVRVEVDWGPEGLDRDHSPWYGALLV